MKLKKEAGLLFDQLESLVELICQMASMAGLNHFKDPKAILAM